MYILKCNQQSFISWMHAHLIWPNTLRALCPTVFSGTRLMRGPKHSISVPFSVKFALPLSVDENEGPIVPNPVPGLAVKSSFGPHMLSLSFAVVSVRTHSMLPFTLQMMIPLMSAWTVQLKVKVSPGQVAGAGVNILIPLPTEKTHLYSTVSHITVQVNALKKFFVSVGLMWTQEKLTVTKITGVEMPVMWTLSTANTMHCATSPTLLYLHVVTKIEGGNVTL